MDLEKCYKLHQGSVLPTAVREKTVSVGDLMYFKDSSWVTEGIQLFDSLCEITGSHNRGQS